jgi:hypothetical protein
MIRRVLDPALDRSFHKRADDGDSEKDLVGAIDGNEDWATSLQKEEKAIQKEDQKVESVTKVEIVDKVDDKAKNEDNKEEKPAEAE